MSEPTRIAILWTQLSGYLVAAVRELSNCPDVEVRVFARSAAVGLGNAGFDDELSRGIDMVLLGNDDDPRWASLPSDVAAFDPSLLVVAGWGIGAYREAAIRLGRQGGRVVLAMDTPYVGRRHALTRRALLDGRHRRFRAAVDAAFVPGERGERFAASLGFPADRIFRGLYAYDSSLFGSSPPGANDPSRLLYVGQYHTTKGLDLLLDAYSSYCQRVASPWPLTCAGRGPLDSRVTGASTVGVVNLGFVQPPDQPALFRSHDVLLLPSRADAWGVVLAEASAVGLPVVCTDSCGAAPDLVSHRYNGLVLNETSADSIRHALLWLHERPARVREMWGRGCALAAPYASSRWPDRVRALLD